MDVNTNQNHRASRMFDKLSTRTLLVLPFFMAYLSYCELRHEMPFCNGPPKEQHNKRSIKDDMSASREFSIVANGTLDPAAFRMYLAVAYARVCSVAGDKFDTIQVLQFANEQALTSISTRSAFGNATRARLAALYPAAPGERWLSNQGLCVAVAPLGQRAVAAKRTAWLAQAVVLSAPPPPRAELSCQNASAQLVLNAIRLAETEGLPKIRKRRAPYNNTGKTDGKPHFENNFPDKTTLKIIMASAGGVTLLLFILGTTVLLVRKLQLLHRANGDDKKSVSAKSFSSQKKR